MITASELVSIFPGCGDPDTWAKAISAAWDRFGFTSKNQRAGFLGIIGNETGGLRQVKRENMNYSYARASQVWPGKAGTVMADRVERGPEAFTSWIYAGIIGNGNEASGDGWRYRGGGIIQLTGRANYRAAGKGIGVDLEANPELIADDPNVSAMVAAWFMARYVNILPLLDSDKEADFLAGARKVGLPADDSATVRRVCYRRAALKVVGPAGYVRKDGNVTRKDIKDSTIVRDSNRGAVAGTIAAGAAAAPAVLTSVGGLTPTAQIILAGVAAAAAIGAAIYFLKIRKRRKRMHSEGIA